MVNRVVTGAHYGLGDWLVQRLSAVLMLLYVVVLLAALGYSAPSGYAAWKAFAAQSWLRLSSFLFVVALAWHAWVGMRDVLMDYVKPTGMRLALEALVVVVLIAYAGWSFDILWGL
jgi:succinate dehydrogenase / fumarate reductase membrane anchor subunit